MVTSAIGSNAYTSSTTASDAVYARVEQQMAPQKKTVTKINDALTQDQTKLSALGQLQAALADFQSVAQGLAGKGLSNSASSSVKGVASASAADQAVAASYAVNVTQLAQSQVLNSTAFKSADSAIGSGSAAVVKVEFGATAGARFSAGGAATRSVTINSANNSLQGIADAFKGAGIDAKVVKSGGGYALAVSGPSGSAGSMRISVTGDAAVKNLLTYNPAGNMKLSEATAAQDAVLTVDGKTIKSASNTVSVAAGTTLSLTGKGSTSVTVSQDAGNIAANVGSLVSAYNTLNAKLQTLQKGDLKSDPALAQVSRELSLNGASAATLAKAGITVGSNGSLQIDDKKLNAAIVADPAAVGKLFTNGGSGVADQLTSKIGALNGSGGSIRREVTTVDKDISSLNGKRDALAKAFTTQATALVNLYAAQETSGSSALPGYTGPKSLFDFMA